MKYLLRFAAAILLISFVPPIWTQQEVEVQTPYVATPPAVVDGMLRLAAPKTGDVIYDLGCGDGRIVIAAARQYGLRGLGVDIDANLINRARENARHEGVAELVKFEVGDLYQTDLHGATIVALYLLQNVNLKLRPKLIRELRPGARIVTQTFDMGDWKPVKREKVEGHDVFLWILTKNEKL